eukprot:gene1253-1677_t
MSDAILSRPAQVRKSLTHRTISSAVGDELRRRILDGSFQSGFQLRQDALAEKFGVSRIPIREALMQLEAEGLVKILPHKGAIVSELSIAEIDELFELRVLLEPKLLEASAPQLTAGDFAQLNAILDEYSSEINARHVSRWGELNTRFHMLLYRHAEKPRSLLLVANLLQDCDRHARIQLSLDNNTERAHREHTELVALCEAGKIADACALLTSHIEHETLMRSSKVIHIVGCHAEGEVGDVIVGGVVPPPGETIWEQSRFIARDETLRNFVLNEPRGGVFRHVNLLVPPKDPQADMGWIIMEPADTPPMSGSNAMCVATVLLDT